jgi:pimeloyl-ACP methyl ester carboxylesterase
VINTPVTIDHFAAKVWRTPVVAEILWRVANARLMRLMLRRQDSGLPDDALDQIAAHTLVSGTQQAAVRLYRSIGKDAIGTYIDRLSQFSGEVLIVWGENDTYVPRDQADQQRRVFRHAQVQLVPGAGNWPCSNNPTASPSSCPAKRPNPQSANDFECIRPHSR